MSIEEWLAGWDALNAERERIAALFEAANNGEARFEEADSARFDLWERESELAQGAAEIFRELRKNSGEPNPEEKYWRHFDGEVCTSASTPPAADYGDGTGVCDEHDRQVTFR